MSSPPSQLSPFPFLTLSPELRLIIYKLVLGSHHIHIRAQRPRGSKSSPFRIPPPTFRHTIFALIFGNRHILIREQRPRGSSPRCLSVLEHQVPWIGISHYLCTTGTSSSPSSSSSANNKDNNNKLIPENKKCPCLGCGQTHTSRLELSFLRTCKQVYEEARLVPYMMNSFEVPRDILDLFLRRQKQDQLKSLRRLAVTGAWRQRRREDSWKITSGIVDKWVRGLDKLVVTLEEGPDTEEYLR